MSGLFGDTDIVLLFDVVLDHLQDSPRGAQEAPRHPQERPKRLQEAAMSAPGGSKKASRDHKRPKDTPRVKSPNFLNVGE